jgi:hypothetical protein
MGRIVERDFLVETAIAHIIYDGKGCSDAAGCKLSAANLNPARDHNAWAALLQSSRRHTGDNLAAQTLPVEGSLPGYNYVTRGDQVGQPNSFQNRANAWHPGSTKVHQGKPQAAGSTGAKRHGRIFAIASSASGCREKF